MRISNEYLAITYVFLEKMKKRINTYRMKISGAMNLQYRMSDNMSDTVSRAI